jgi:preprotein translocase subunit YajC
MIIFLYLALLAAAFFALVVRPQRRQLSQRRALIASLEVGDEVITAGGLYGTIRAIDETKLELEAADGVVLTFAREAISGKQPVDAPESSVGPTVDLATDEAAGDPAGDSHSEPTRAETPE